METSLKSETHLDISCIKPTAVIIPRTGHKGAYANLYCGTDVTERSVIGLESDDLFFCLASSGVGLKLAQS